MAKGKCNCPPPPMEIPKWFVTYSDVITLLMTFFILLLTFASSEPENFERMQITTFGAAGSSGLVGPAAKGPDKASMTVRYRPSSARRTARGSEVPPGESAPVAESANNGLDALDSSDELATAEQISTESPLDSLRGEDGRLNSAAIQQLKLLARQMKILPVNATLQVSQPEEVAFAVGVARFMQDELQVPSGRLSVSVSPVSSTANTLRITIRRQDDPP